MEVLTNPHWNETNLAVSWSKVKSFFEAEARRIGKQWFEA